MLFIKFKPAQTVTGWLLRIVVGAVFDLAVLGFLFWLLVKGIVWAIPLIKEACLR